MLHTDKNSQTTKTESTQINRRKNSDRRKSDEEIRFPFVDDDSKLVMKERRKSSRRTTNSKIINNPLKAVSKLFKK